MNPSALSEVAEQVHGKTDGLAICVVDPDKSTVVALEEMLEEFGFSAVATSDPQEGLDHVSGGRFRVVLCGMPMPPAGGAAFLEQALQRDPGIYVIVMTDFYSIESAIDVIKRGAYDYLPKPIDKARLKKTLDDLAAQFQQQRLVRDLEEKLLNNLEFHGIVGRSPAMLEVFDLMRKISRHYTNVLLTGQTGTGKELIANALHQMSPVSTRRLAVCNCSAVVDTLIESQLFGHVRGAFTGATDTQPGLFEYADGGTVFLDEVADTSLAMQAKLLRVIQNREIQRVGSQEVNHVDVRLIAATNRDLGAEVLAGRFREDLYYRLNTVNIRVPSLAERLEDIPLLVAFFVKKYNVEYHKRVQGLTRRAQTALLQHAWPGNVRELENVISGASLVVASDLIDIHDLPSQVQRPPGHGAKGDTWRPVRLQDVRKEHIRRVLEVCGGNRVRASQMLGIGRTSLYRYLKRKGKINAAEGAQAT
jgi:two-component system, NtrC family, response regulator HydG